MPSVAVTITTDLKNVVLQLGDIEPLAAAALQAFGAGRAAQWLTELAALGAAAVKAFDDAAAVQVTPESIAALLPDDTPLKPPAAAAPTAKEPAAATPAVTEPAATGPAAPAKG